MNGYAILLIETIFIGVIWYLGGMTVGLIALCYCTFMSVLYIRYNRFVYKMINMLKEKIESLGGTI